MKPRVGVISQHSVEPDLLDSIICEGIDLGYLAFIRELEASGKSEEEIEEEAQYYTSDGSEYLYGDWIKIGERYEIDKAGRHGYALTYSSNSGNICVEYSVTTKQCQHTSPCYVMSDGSGPCGDLDTKGTSVVAYALPNELLRGDV